MNLKTINKIPFYQFDKLSEFQDITHFISTRQGGVSKDHLESLNLGSKVGDELQNLNENKHRLASAMGFNADQFVFPVQTHENHVKIIRYDFLSEPQHINQTFLDNTDALITNLSGICLAVLVADCVPVLFYDPIEKVIAATHAGWRGTAKRITRNTVDLMIKNFNCKPQNILACIGPSIGPDVYEVGNEVIEEFRKAYKTTDEILVQNETLDKALLNLWVANKIQLLEAGIPDNNIEISNLCTYKNSDMFFSSRKSNTKTGRFAAGIMLIQ